MQNIGTLSGPIHQDKRGTTTNPDLTPPDRKISTPCYLRRLKWQNPEHLSADFPVAGLFAIDGTESANLLPTRLNQL